MAYVVIRRFRTGEGPSSARVFHEARPARDAAETWYRQGWEVELLADGRRGTPRKREATQEQFPPHRRPDIFAT